MTRRGLKTAGCRRSVALLHGTDQRHTGHYGVVRVLGAVTVFLVFGSVAVAIARVAVNDWREGRQERDAFLLWTAVETFWPALIAAGVALVGPVVILVQS